ncbi:hypothetical protein D3C87_942920 [compost metagenome]
MALIIREVFESRIFLCYRPENIQKSVVIQCIFLSKPEPILVLNLDSFAGKILLEQMRCLKYKVLIYSYLY